MHFLIILGADSSSASEKKKSSLKTLYFTAPFGLLDTSLLKFDDDDNNGDGDNDYYDDNDDDGDNSPPVLLLHPHGHLHSESKVVRPISVSVIIVVQIILSYYKVNSCLARYSPRATTTNRPTNRALNKPA